MLPPTGVLLLAALSSAALAACGGPTEPGGGGKPAPVALRFRDVPHDVVSPGSIGPISVELVGADGEVFTAGEATVQLNVTTTGVTISAPPVQTVAGVARWATVPVTGLAEAVVLTASTGGLQATSPPFALVKAFDLVEFTGATGDEVGLLVDGFLHGQDVNDLGFLFTGDTYLPGAIRRGVSNSLVAFTMGRAPAWVPVAFWSPNVDTVTVDFEPSVVVNLVIYIMKGPFLTQQQKALTAVATTGMIWDHERAGLEIGDVEVIDATGIPGVDQFFSLTLCNQQSAIETTVGIDPSRINIYYAGTVDGGTGRGRACGIGGNHIIMAEATGDELMSHEIGHSFSLLHIDDRIDFFDRTNVMHSASNTRQFLTEAQTFRQQFHGNSAVRSTFGARASYPTVFCEVQLGNDCPRLELRLWADGTFGANGLGPLTAPVFSPTPTPDVRLLETSCFAGAAIPPLVAAASRTGIGTIQLVAENGPSTSVVEEAVAAAEDRAEGRRAWLRRGGWPSLDTDTRAFLLSTPFDAQRERTRVRSAWQSAAQDAARRIDQLH